MIIRTYMEAQDRERLVALARTETDQALRMEAVRQLGNMRAGAELTELYQRETSLEVKKQILRGMSNGGSIDRLIAVVDTEKDPELKRTAIRTIGNNRDTGPQLVNFYTKDTNLEVRKAVIDALFIAGQRHRARHHRAQGDRHRASQEPRQPAGQHARQRRGEGVSARDC